MGNTNMIGDIIEAKPEQEDSKSSFSSSHSSKSKSVKMEPILEMVDDEMEQQQEEVTRNETTAGQNLRRKSVQFSLSG